MSNTTHRNYPKPVPEHNVSDDVALLQQALDAVDGDIHLLFAAIADLAPVNHEHVITDVQGLSAALAGKSDSTHSHTIEDLSDVGGTTVAPAGYVLVKQVDGTWGPASPASVVGLHQHLIGDVVNLQDALDSKAAKNSPTFTGTVSGITKAMVGLANVNNTSDADKPVSTAAALALAAKLASADIATASHYWGNVAGKILTTGVWASAEWVDLGAFTGNVSLNFDTFINGYALATANFTFFAASGTKKQSGTMEVSHAGGPYTASVNTAVFETAGPLKLSSVANAKDLIGYQRLRNGKVFLSVLARGSA